MLLYAVSGHCPHCKVELLACKPSRPIRKAKVRPVHIPDPPKRLLYGRPQRSMVPVSDLHAALDKLASQMGY
jgi:hypothetical protein